MDSSNGSENPSVHSTYHSRPYPAENPYQLGYHTEQYPLIYPAPQQPVGYPVYNPYLLSWVPYSMGPIHNGLRPHYDHSMSFHHNTRYNTSPGWGASHHSNRTRGHYQEVKENCIHHKLRVDEEKVSKSGIFNFPQGSVPRIVVPAPGATNVNTILVSGNTESLETVFPFANHVEVKPLSEMNMERLRELCGKKDGEPPVPECHAFVVFPNAESAINALNSRPTLDDGVTVHGRVCDLRITVDIGKGPEKILHMSDGDKENIFVKQFPPHFKDNRACSIQKLFNKILESDNAVLSIKVCDKNRNHHSQKQTIGALIRFRTAEDASRAIEIVKSPAFKEEYGLTLQAEGRKENKKGNKKDNSEEAPLPKENEHGDKRNQKTERGKGDSAQWGHHEPVTTMPKPYTSSRAIVSCPDQTNSIEAVWRQYSQFGAIKEVKAIDSKDGRCPTSFEIVFVRCSGDPLDAKKQAEAFCDPARRSCSDDQFPLKGNQEAISSQQVENEPSPRVPKKST